MISIRCLIWINKTFISAEIQTIYKSVLSIKFWDRETLIQKESKRGILQGRNKYRTQFIGLQRTTCGQEASKICIEKTFISAEIQAIYKLVLIYQILGPRD